MKEKLGFAGKFAHAFIDSKLTPLIIAASILLGVGAVLMLPEGGRASDHRADDRYLCADARSIGQGGGGAGHEAHGTTPLGDPRGGVHLLHVVARLFDGHCPVSRWVRMRKRASSGSIRRCSPTST